MSRRLTNKSQTQTNFQQFNGGKSHLKSGNPDANNIVWHPGLTSEAMRQQLMGQRPVTLWLTGLSGSGKSTIAFHLEQKLLERGHSCYVLDGDNLRHHLNSDLGFSPLDRRENIRRAAEVASLFNQAGLIVITSFISPYQSDRAMAQQIIGTQRFIEVHINTPVEVCEQRDCKGLYARARRGEIPEFTGVSAPYEQPQNPALEINTAQLSCVEATEHLYKHLMGLCFDQ